MAEPDNKAPEVQAPVAKAHRVNPTISGYAPAIRCGQPTKIVIKGKDFVADQDGLVKVELKCNSKTAIWTTPIVLGRWDKASGEITVLAIASLEGGHKGAPGIGDLTITVTDTSGTSVNPPPQQVYYDN
jgi:hypothetical protein